MKKLLCLLLLIPSINSVFGQDTLYYDLNRKPVKKGMHSLYKIIKEDTKNPKLTGEFLYKSNGTPVSSDLFKNYRTKKKDRITYARFYDNGQLHVQSGMDNGKRHGELITYWENGTLKRKDVYKKGKFLEGKCWDKAGKELTHYPFEIDSQFPGGSKMLAAYFKREVNPQYHSAPYKGQKVLVKFKILKTGVIDQIEVVSGGHINLKIEAVRLVENMPKWSPGYMDGEPVTTSKVLPIQF